MSYPKDIEDYSDAELKSELDFRRNRRLQAKCGYCSVEISFGITHGCKHAEREVAAINELFKKNKPAVKPKPEPFCDDCG
jgi:hypothetical protein